VVSKVVEKLPRRDAETIAKVLTTADGECCVCAERLGTEMNKAFPEHDWVALVHRAEGRDEE